MRVALQLLTGAGEETHSWRMLDAWCSKGKNVISIQGCRRWELSLFLFSDGPFPFCYKTATLNITHCTVFLFYMYSNFGTGLK
jgi:hypothetical protein